MDLSGLETTPVVDFCNADEVDEPVIFFCKVYDRLVYVCGVCRLSLDMVAGDAAEGLALVRAASCNGFDWN